MFFADVHSALCSHLFLFLVDAASVASLLTTSEVIITDAPEPKADAGAAAGMGGGHLLFSLDEKISLVAVVKYGRSNSYQFT